MKRYERHHFAQRSHNGRAGRTGGGGDPRPCTTTPQASAPWSVMLTARPWRGVEATVPTSHNGRSIGAGLLLSRISGGRAAVVVT